MADMQPLDDILAFIAKTWPDITIDEARIAGWRDEIESGTGRTAAEIRLDIIKHIVTDERVDKYVADAFSERGIDPKTSEEGSDERVQRISDELQTGRSFAELNQTLDKHGTKTDATPDPGTVDVGGTIIPTGMRLVKVTNPSGSDRAAIYYVVGTVFGVDVAFEVGGQDRLNELFGGVDAFDHMSTVTQKQWDSSDTLELGSVDEIAGSTESLQAQYERDLREQGMENPPRWMQDDPKAMATMITAANEGWSAERTWGSLAKLDSFKARFPGLDTVQGQLGTTQIGPAVAEYRGRETQIRQALGRRRGPHTDTSPEYVSSIVASGWQPSEVDELLDLEQEVRNNPEALKNINLMLAMNGQGALTADDFVDLIREDRMSGNPGFTPSATFEAVNDALRWTALQNAGVDIDPMTAESLGTGTSTSVDSAYSFRDDAQHVAGIIAANANQLDLGSYGLTKEHVVQFFMGDQPDPEVGRKLERIAREKNIAARGLGGPNAYVGGDGRLRVQGLSDLK